MNKLFAKQIEPLLTKLITVIIVIIIILRHIAGYPVHEPGSVLSLWLITTYGGGRTTGRTFYCKMDAMCFKVVCALLSAILHRVKGPLMCYISISPN
jgi:hypothetical protein